MIGDVVIPAQEILEAKNAPEVPEEKEEPTQKAEDKIIEEKTEKAVQSKDEFPKTTGEKSENKNQKDKDKPE